MDWTENTLVPSPFWGDGVTDADWALGTQYQVLIGADVPWRSVVPACPDCLPRSPPESSCATAHRVCDARLQENRLTRAQNVLYAQHAGVDGRVNWPDENWDDLCGELANQ